MALMCSNSVPKIRLLARFVIANVIDCSKGGKEEKAPSQKTDDDFSSLARNLKTLSLLGADKGMLLSDFQVCGSISY